MAAPTFNAANGVLNDTAGLTTLTLSSFAASGGSDRLLVVFVLGEAGTAENPTGVTWGGEALTSRGSHNVSTYSNLQIWYLKEADFPSGATGNVVATWSNGQNARWMHAIVLDGVNQATPFRNGSVTGETDASTNTPSFVVSSNADDIVVAATFGAQGTAGISAVSVTSGTERGTELNAYGYTVMSLATGVGASSTTVSWSFTNDSTADYAGMIGDSIQGLGGGSIVPQAMANYRMRAA